MSTIDSAVARILAGDAPTFHYVSEYEVERLYGGPEEGGWWYDWRTFVRCVAAFTSEDDAYAHARALNAATDNRDHYGRNRRDRFCVNGGPDVEYTVESHPGEDETRERPHYE